MYQAFEDVEDLPDQYVLFKHSNTCPVSAAAKRAMDTVVKDNALPVYLLVVQEQRALSNAVEAKLGVKHESPQVIVKKEGVAVLNHNDITVENVQRALS